MKSTPHVTRRGLLRAAAAACAAPWFLSASARASSRRVAPGDRLAMGFIGVGNMGGGHVGYFLGDRDVQIVAVCDVDADKREKFRRQIEDHYADERDAGTFSGCAVYNDYEELLARPDIDCVLIAVPDHWHAIISIAACRAGKDVYCEKPLALTVREAEQMVVAARRYGSVFQTGSQQRSDRNFRFASELVRNGRIGRLRRITVNIGLPSADRQFATEPVRPGLDWERWLGPAPWSPYSAERCSGDYSGGWRLIRDYSGGMTTDWGAHHFDICQWAMGQDETGGPEEILPPGGPDQPTLTYRYPGGVTMSRGSCNGILFEGDGGKIEVNRGHFRTEPDEIGRTPIAPGEVRLYDSPHHQRNWIECIRSRRRPICDVAIGASSVTVCHLGNIACWTGRPIRWDAARREIVGDAEASRWLDRPKRAPYRIDL